MVKCKLEYNPDFSDYYYVQKTRGVPRLLGAFAKRLRDISYDRM